MSVRRFFSSLFTLLLFGSLVYSQNTEIEVLKETFTSRLPMSVTEDTEGSPYIDEKFAPIRINDYNVVYVGRYNAFNGDMEVLMGDSKTPNVLDIKNNFVIKFIDDNKIYKNFSYIDGNGNTKNAFFLNAFTSGDYGLLIKESIRFQEGFKANSGYGTDRPPMYVREKDSYFIKMNDNKVIEVPRKSKDLIDFFSNHKDKIKDFIKDEKIKTNDQSDLIKFVKFLNTL